MNDRSGEDVLKLVAERLIEARTRRGLTLEEAATLAKVDAQRLAEAEAAETTLDGNELDALATAYDIEPGSFFGVLDLGVFRPRRSTF
jgi:transcriptional regulator with XRE-family HTH domain